MKSVAVLLLGFLFTAQTPPIGKVESTFDKTANFSTLRSYQWLPGTPAFNPAVHKLIVDALEADMTTLGFTKAASGADVTLAYYAMAVTNVDLKALDKIERDGGSLAAANKTLGRLVVVMRSVPAGGQLWSASTREYLEADIEKLGGTIQVVTAHLFNTYPGSKTK